MWPAILLVKMHPKQTLRVVLAFEKNNKHFGYHEHIQKRTLKGDTDMLGINYTLL